VTKIVTVQQDWLSPVELSSVDQARNGRIAGNFGGPSCLAGREHALSKYNHLFLKDILYSVILLMFPGTTIAQHIPANMSLFAF
jgi:hypothetical protein